MLKKSYWNKQRHVFMMTCSRYRWNIVDTLHYTKENENDIIVPIYRTSKGDVIFRWGLATCVIPKGSDVMNKDKLKVINYVKEKGTGLRNKYHDLSHYLVDTKTVSAPPGYSDVDSKKSSLPFDLTYDIVRSPDGKAWVYDDTVSILIKKTQDDGIPIICLSETANVLKRDGGIPEGSAKDIEVKLYTPMFTMLSAKQLTDEASSKFTSTLKKANEFAKTIPNVLYQKEDTPLVSIMPNHQISIKEQVKMLKRNKDLSFIECIMISLFDHLYKEKILQFDFTTKYGDEEQILVENESLTFKVNRDTLHQMYTFEDFANLFLDVLPFNDMLCTCRQKKIKV